MLSVKLVNFGLWFLVILIGISKNCFVVGKSSCDAVILHVTILPDLNIDPLILFFRLISIWDPVSLFSKCSLRVPKALASKKSPWEEVTIQFW